ncbi:MAG: SPOR domain-containing protein, partial [Nitrospinae bacterium]|nr:SPOR domain-containing protein [Nitrospinota bacterium]
LPTGMFAAVYAPIYFVTNKLNLRKMTTDMTNEMTALVRKPEEKPAFGKNSGEVQLAQATRKRATDMRTPRSGGRRDDRSPVLSRPGAVPAKAVSPASAAHSGERIKPLPDIKTAPRRSEPAPVQLAALRTPEKKNAVRKRTSAKGRAKEPVSPENDDSVFYTIQVGAYQTKAFAESMINSLAMKGYNAFMTMLHNNGGDYYKVQVERFDDKERAQMFSKELEIREKLNTFVIRFD